MTPTCIKALYQIPNAHLKDNINQLGIYEHIDAYSQPDLDLFFAKYVPYVPQGTHPLLDSVDGGQAPVAPNSALNSGESDVDMSLGFALIYVSNMFSSF